MTKTKVVETLGIEPYEIFHGLENGCEIHQFKYKHKEISHGTLNSYDNTNKGSDLKLIISCFTFEQFKKPFLLNN